MRTLRAILGAVVAVAMGACSAARAPEPVEAPRSRTRPTSVLLISLDAFRADYFERGLTPRLAQLARGGVRAEWMVTSYPSLTFPSHYSIVTGLRPDRHGIVHNTMRDPALGSFSLSNRDAVGNGAWWGGAPVWVTAERAGLPTATFFWPGSEAAIQGVRPTRWKPYDESIKVDARVETVLEWLSEDASTRPRLITLYAETLDDAGHSHGPDSDQLRGALGEVDVAMGRLLDGLAARSLLDVVDLVITSDHGLAAVPPGNTVAVEDMVDPRDAAVVTTGQSVGFNPLPGREKEAYARLIGAHERYDCWRKDDLPARWHYGKHPRVPAIVCQMHEGWDAGLRASLAKRPAGATRGSHGFDPALPSMRTIFIASGPSFRTGLVVPAIENVDVYPLLTSLLGLEPAEHDGNPRALAPALIRQKVSQNSANGRERESQ
jgi:predicted AlkP superfamily pyrophosphatase or phosphodiesterase